MTKINYFREDLAKLLSKYDAELSIDDKGNIIQVYFWEEKKTYSVCKNVPDLKEESINHKDIRLSIEVDSNSSEIPNSSFFCNDEKHYPQIGRCKNECEMCRTERLKNATKR